MKIINRILGWKELGYNFLRKKKPISVLHSDMLTVVLSF